MLTGVLRRLQEAGRKERAVKDFVQMVEMGGLKDDLLNYRPDSGTDSVRFISWVTKAIVPFYLKKKLPGDGDLGRTLKVYNSLVQNGQFRAASKSFDNLVAGIKLRYNQAKEGSLLEWGWVERLPYDGVSFSGMDSEDAVQVNQPIPGSTTKKALKSQKRQKKMPPKDLTEWRSYFSTADRKAAISKVRKGINDLLKTWGIAPSQTKFWSSWAAGCPMQISIKPELRKTVTFPSEILSIAQDAKIMGDLKVSALVTVNDTSIMLPMEQWELLLQKAPQGFRSAKRIKRIVKKGWSPLE